MTSPTDVATFHAEYDKHPDDRVRLFGAVVDFIPSDAEVLYPGSYIDIAPSVFFDSVTYVDTDKRAARWFAQTDAVVDLIGTKCRNAGRPAETSPTVAFHHQDYSDPIPVAERSVDLLVSLYAGFISEACTRYLRPGGHLFTNNSHGDGSMAAVDERYELVAVLISRDGDYRVSTADLDTYLQPKRGTAPTPAELHQTNRGIAYTRSPYAYIFRRRWPPAANLRPREDSNLRLLTSTIATRDSAVTGPT